MYWIVAAKGARHQAAGMWPVMPVAFRLLQGTDRAGSVGGVEVVHVGGWRLLAEQLGESRQALSPALTTGAQRPLDTYNPALKPSGLTELLALARRGWQGGSRPGRDFPLGLGLPGVTAGPGTARKEGNRAQRADCWPH